MMIIGYANDYFDFFFLFYLFIITLTPYSVRFDELQQ
jgi:hypothetical protein